MTGKIQRLRTGPRMSKIVLHAGLIFLSGQTANGTKIPDLMGQTREVLKRIDDLLAEAGSDKSYILSATIYLRDISDSGAMNTEWELWMPENTAPARTTVEASLASPDLLVEISIVAATQVAE
jgi:enamine deaminase RidA (YjgF/YER057c/UK114 family)